MTLRYQLDQVDDGLRVRLSGELDVSTADELADLLLSAIIERRAAAVEVNLADVSFLDSSTIAVLVQGHRAAHGRGCRFQLSHPQDMVRRVLDVTGVLRPLTEPLN